MLNKIILPLVTLAIVGCIQPDGSTSTASTTSTADLNLTDITTYTGRYYSTYDRKYYVEFKSDATFTGSVQAACDHLQFRNYCDREFYGTVNSVQSTLDQWNRAVLNVTTTVVYKQEYGSISIASGLLDYGQYTLDSYVTSTTKNCFRLQLGNAYIGVEDNDYFTFCKE